MASSPVPVAQNMSLEQLSRYFHLPINDVAKELGVCATVLKKICRRNGIPRWPHRKIKSFEKRIANLEAALLKTPEEEPRITQELAALKEKKGFLMRKQKRAPTSGISKHGLKRGPLAMQSDSESDDDADFQPSAKEPVATRSSNPTIAPEARASEQLAALQRRAALLSVMSGAPTSAFAMPTAIRQPAALPPSANPCFLPKFSVLEPSPLSYIPSTFSLLPSPAYRCLPPPTTGLAPYYGPKSEREADGLDGLAELSKAAALESAQPILQDDTWRGSLVSHTGRNGVASSAHVLV